MKQDLWRINFFNDADNLIKTEQVRFLSSASSVLNENKNLDAVKIELVFEIGTDWDEDDESDKDSQNWERADQIYDERRGT